MIQGFFKWTLFIYIISFSFFYYHCYHALDKQERVRRLCPNVPKALGTFNRDSRLKVLMYMVTFAHVHGHVCSCTWSCLLIMMGTFNALLFAAFPAY